MQVYTFVCVKHLKDLDISDVYKYKYKYTLKGEYYIFLILSVTNKQILFLNSILAITFIESI